jgi:GNAT superfamily N-acetyltransferase
MSEDLALAQRLSASLPDVPRWVEAKWMLLNLSCEILALEEKPALSFVLLDRRTHSVEVVGLPDREAIASAAVAAGHNVEIIAPIESLDHTATALPGWTAQPAALHVLADDSHLPYPDRSVRLLSGDEVRELDVPDELHKELLLAQETSRGIAARMVDGRPVSFCYPGSETDTLWDVSIDTLEAHRQKGYGAACVRFVIDLMREHGKEPIWGALEDNSASMRLATKLGFVPVDRIVVFERL